MGNEIRLKANTWNYHIIGGDHHRLELVNQENVVKDVLADPSMILPNSDDPNDTRQKYIDFAQLPGCSTVRNLVVVVDHANDDFGDVVTAIAKKNLNGETGGAVYVRPKSTRSE
ncbi:hypothetical protein [Ectobacillus polymachus]|uniref:hypothetical protein n=1 Tax=Ectobacillus polymachus TaxID=1508806 RepID=UPI003A85EB5B